MEINTEVGSYLPTGTSRYKCFGSVCIPILVPVPVPPTVSMFFTDPDPYFCCNRDSNPNQGGNLYPGPPGSESRTLVLGFLFK